VNAPGKLIEEALAGIAQLLASLGFPRSCARILAALYLASTPLSSRELAEMTGYSKSAISAALKALEGSHLILRLRRGRVSTYAPAISLSNLVAEVQARLLERIRARIRRLGHQVNSSLGAKLHSLDDELSTLIMKLRGERGEGG